MSDTTAGPCCGTAHAAEQAGACCDPAAKTEAVATGASCCGTAAAESASAETPSAAADSCCGSTSAGSDTHTTITAVAAAGTNPRADEQLPVVVIGAGPVGLAAAAHLHERGLAFTVVEAGDTVPARRSPNGATCGCSRRGGTTSTRPPAGCSTPPAGPGPTWICCPPAPSWSSSTCSRWRSCRTSRRTSATPPGSSRSAGSASTGSRPPGATRPRSWCASPAVRTFSRPRSSTPPAPGPGRTCSAPTGCPRTASRTPPP